MQNLARWLTELGTSVETTKEPTSGPLGGVIRQVIDKRTELHPAALALAFAADRVDHLTNSVNGIEGHVRNGSWVLCDRYLFSSIAYQASDTIDTAWLIEINRFAPTPDLTIFVDTDPDICMDRIRSRSGNDELFHDEGVLRRALSVYRHVISDGRLAGRLVVVDGNNKVDDVASDVSAAVRGWMQEIG